MITINMSGVLVQTVQNVSVTEYTCNICVCSTFINQFDNDYFCLSAT